MNRKPGFTLPIVAVKELISETCAHYPFLTTRAASAYVNHYSGAYRMRKSEISERAKAAHARNDDSVERYETVMRYGREERLLVTYRRVRLYFPLPNGAAEFGYVSPPPLDTVSRQYPGNQPKVLMPNGKWEPVNAAYIDVDPPPGSVDIKGRPMRPVRCYGVQIKYKHSERVACNELCVFAEKPHCTCSCGGENHGSGTVETITTLLKDDELRDVLRALGLSAMDASVVMDTSEYFG
jgi:hypothetical protein